MKLFTITATPIMNEAQAQEEAEKWLFDELSLNGIGEFTDENAQFEAKVTDREYNTQNAKEIE